jgi:S-DNA-T family DNA segregation ATPase FtsK/SpoIIIE
MEPEEDLDPLFDEAVDLVRRQGRASISMLQRRLRIGYTRGARLIETMQEKGIVGPSQPGTQGLEVLDYGPAAPPVGED